MTTLMMVVVVAMGMALMRFLSHKQHFWHFTETTFKPQIVEYCLRDVPAMCWNFVRLHRIETARVTPGVLCAFTYHAAIQESWR